MRKPSTLDALFTAPRKGILAVTLMNPERWWYLSDLARQLDVHHATLQRELARLTAADVLLSRRDGNRAYYRANTESPVFLELRALLAKTAGLADEIRDALESFAGKITVAFVYGSVARAEEAAQSDVDLMIVGGITLRELAPALRKAEKVLRRPINTSIYGDSDFGTKMAAKNHFLLDVIGKPKLFVVGKEDDLDRLAQGRARRVSSARSSGSRRAAAGR